MRHKLEFCKYICPPGAIYSVFNLISVFSCRVDHFRLPEA